jgi:rhodanese-related sulfurtransferase
MTTIRGQMNCDARELREALAAGGILVDVREYPEYAAGRIPGARLIPLGELERRAEDLDPASAIYVVCRSGRRGAEAQEKLSKLGFKEVRNVGGGMLAWEAAGYGVERDERAPWALERQVRFVAGLLVLLGVLLSVFVAQPFIWLAGLVGAGLVFAAVTDTCKMGLLLARLPYNRAATPVCGAVGTALKEE